MANRVNPRAQRLAETIRRLLSEWLEQQPPDRQLGFVTITDVTVRNDLRHAKVYVTVLDPGLAAGAVDPAGADPEQTMETLRELLPEARTWVAQRVRLRFAPTLEFLDDDVAKQGARIDQLLTELRAADERADEAADGGEDRPAAGERQVHDRHP